MDKRAKLLDLANRATNPTGEVDHEAANAARLACQLILENQHLLIAEGAPDEQWSVAPPKRSRPSIVHEHAAQQRAWRALLREKHLHYSEAGDDSICADCGLPIATGHATVELIHDPELVTHRECAGWWWQYDPPAPPPTTSYDDEIPF